MNLSIEAAHGNRALVALKQPQFHVLFGSHIGLSAFDQGVEIRRLFLGNSWVAIEIAIVPAPASDVVADAIGDQVLVIDLGFHRVSAACEDPSQ